MRSATRCTRRRIGPDGDRGSVALFFAITAMAAIVMLGFVVDLGGALAARERAADLATQAARAGADALTPTSLRGAPTGLQINPAAAQLAVNRVLDAAGDGVTGTVTVLGDRVTVTVHVQRRTVILSAVGVDDLSQGASATATPIFGQSGQEGS
jgi:Flp pilus assembly protein TadG